MQSERIIQIIARRALATPLAATPFSAAAAPPSMRPSRTGPGWRRVCNRSGKKSALTRRSERKRETELCGRQLSSSVTSHSLSVDEDELASPTRPAAPLPATSPLALRRSSRAEVCVRVACGSAARAGDSEAVPDSPDRVGYEHSYRSSSIKKAKKNYNDINIPQQQLLGPDFFHLSALTIYEPGRELHTTSGVEHILTLPTGGASSRHTHT